ncbi:peptidylprolyl isomerase [Halalkalibacter alkalisediminis]|uniref:Peptidylprolyl isomerase n=1 Tax=Halalkalibacter alkalisediminis TaxID=935616 RepID=A0ABV6NLE0_9BACI
MATATLTGMLLVTACGGQPEQEETVQPKIKETEKATEPTEPIIVDEYPIVTITMENGYEIEAELYPHIAPNTVVNFISLVEDGSFDGPHQ